MILTVTPNPALDRIELIPAFKPGYVWRAHQTILLPGGKGVNVARAASNLGGKVTCAGFLGGHTGRQHAEMVALEGIAASWTWIDGHTRAAIVIVDAEPDETDALTPEQGWMTVINEEGPAVTKADWERLTADVLKQAARASAVSLSGSLPPGLPPQLMGDLVRALHRLRRRVWVDTSGATLAAAIQARPAVVKVNNLEAAALLGWRHFDDLPTALQAARTIQQNGISQVIITLGKDGAILAGDAGAWHARPPAIQVICPIGSGDAFLGGLLMAWEAHLPDPDTLRQAVAVGAANALTIGGGKFTLDDFHRILAETKLKKID